MNADFQQRRKALLAQLDTDAVVIISNGPEVIRNGSLYYPYHPKSHFYYLTGLDEPNAIVCLIQTANKPKFLLFCLERTDVTVNWSVPPVGLQHACLEYGADEAYAISAFENRITPYIEKSRSIYWLMQEESGIIQTLFQRAQHTATHTLTSRKHWIDVSPYLERMRITKSPDEIFRLRQAAIISAKAHERAMKFCRPGLYEYEIAAELHHELERQGCQNLSYESIVASGENACTLHYQRNKSPLISGKLLLVDAGCEYKYYTADITRTFPINGKFTPHQKLLYTVVLQAQIEAIQATKPGVTWIQLNTIVETILIEGLLDIGLLSPTLSKKEKVIALRAIYPHRLGHHLGLDVHDSPRQLAEDTALKSNMVITLEPGIYISSRRQDIASEWRGIGIRIEDDILVTDTGCEVLSAGAPKTIEDIENIMSRA